MDRCPVRALAGTYDGKGLNWAEREYGRPVHIDRRVRRRTVVMGRDWLKNMAERFERLANDDGGEDNGPPDSVRLRMVDSSSVHVHMHGAGAPRGAEHLQVGPGRSGRTTNVHLGIDGNETARTM